MKYLLIVICILLNSNAYEVNNKKHYLQQEKIKLQELEKKQKKELEETRKKYQNNIDKLNNMNNVKFTRNKEVIFKEQKIMSIKDYKKDYKKVSIYYYKSGHIIFVLKNNDKLSINDIISGKCQHKISKNTYRICRYKIIHDYNKKNIADDIKINYENNITTNIYKNHFTLTIKNIKDYTKDHYIVYTNKNNYILNKTMELSKMDKIRGKCKNYDETMKTYYNCEYTRHNKR